MSKWDNLEKAIEARFIQLGFTYEDAVHHTLLIWRDWDKLNNESKMELYEMEDQAIKDQEQLQKYI